MNKVTRPDRQFVMPTKLDMQYWYFDMADIAWIVTWGSAAAMMVVAKDFLSALLLVLFTLASLIRRKEGRLYYWAFDKLRDLALRFFKKGKVWTASKKTPFYNPFGTVYDVTDADGKHFGLVRVDASGTYAGVVISKGDRTASADATVQRRRRSQLAFRLTQHNSDTGYSWLYSAKPFNPWSYRRHKNAALNPRVYLPEQDEEIAEGDQQGPQDQAAHRFFNRHIGEKEPLYTKASRNVTEASTIMVPGNTRLPSKDADTVDYRAFANAPVVRALTLQKNAWGDYGAATHIATYQEIKRILRSTWDTKGLVDTKEGATTYYTQEELWLHHGGDEPSHLPGNSVRAHKDHLLIDGNYITVVEATTMPGVADVYSLKNLYGLLGDDESPVDYSIVQVGTNANAKSDRWWVNFFGGVSKMFRDLYMTSSRSYESRARDAEAEARKNLIGGTRNKVYTFNLLCFVYSTTRYESEQMTAAAMKAFDADGLTPEIVVGEHRLLRAWKSSWGVNFM